MNQGSQDYNTVIKSSFSEQKENTIWNKIKYSKMPK